MAEEQKFEDAAFIKAGIQRVYLRTTLTKQLPVSQPALDYVKREEFAAELKEDGRGVIVSGNAPVNGDILTLIAKSAMVRQVSCRVMTLPEVVDYATGTDEGEPIEAPALFITRFSDPDFPANPYTKQVQFTVEEFLSTHIREGGSLSVAVPRAWGGAWWSTGFVALLNKNTGRVEL